MATTTVCILTAGQGSRMGDYAGIINKALLPIKQKPIISLIMSHFPETTEFVIGLGYKQEQVRTFLEITYPERTFHFVTVDKLEGPGSGPGYSLLCCKEHLQKPFYFVSCDTLWDKQLNLQKDCNWLGVSRVPEEQSANYCNVEIENRRVLTTRDKELVSGDQYRAFTGLMHIQDYSIFWESLEKGFLIRGEHQVSSGIFGLLTQSQVFAEEMDWIDVGTAEQYKNAVARYENYDFSKTNEFLYLLEGKVIKFFKDASITQKRVEKSKLNPEVFPQITHHQDQFYAYDFAPGQTLYQHNNRKIFTQFLNWLDQHLWHSKPCPDNELRAICQKFYYEKTRQRLDLYQEKYEKDREEKCINGVTVPPIDTLLEQVPWETLYRGKAVFMHGDLQFDNVLYAEQETNPFVLLDWRQEFGGHVDLGDLYYDLAKLNGGIILNYDLIKLGQISYSEEGNEIYIDFTQRYVTRDYEAILHRFIDEKGLDLRKVKLLVPLIYLNMSPLHHYPFDKMLFSLGKLMLHQEFTKGS